MFKEELSRELSDPTATATFSQTFLHMEKYVMPILYVAGYVNPLGTKPLRV